MNDVAAGQVIAPSDNEGYQRAVSQQGHYAGGVTLVVGFIIDQFVIATTFSIGSAAVTYVIRLVTGQTIELAGRSGLVGALVVVWSFCYFAGCWGVSGQTVGMALVGLRVVAADGSIAGGRSAVLRTLALPLGFATAGIGFLGILFRSDRRAWHDRIGGTAVVYSWDARGSQLRFLASRRAR